MGTWRITIDGAGCHHNSNRAIDADLATAEFVRELQAQGHTIRAARFEQRGCAVTPAGTNADGEPIAGTYDPDAVNPTSPMNIDFLNPSDE